MLNRIAKGVMLTEPEREHLFVLGLGRPPVASYRSSDEVTAQLQRVQDALTASPAIIKTAIWDVVAWNAAPATLLTDYGKLSREESHILQIVFTNHINAAQPDWLAITRHVMGAFRADAAQAGAKVEIERLVEKLSQLTPSSLFAHTIMTCWPISMG